MKKFLFITVVFLGACLQTIGQNIVEKQGPIITFEKKSHDFGDIEQGDKVEHTFEFSNTGTEPLIITNVEVTCGCTTPKGWPRDPIAPGEKGELIVSFSSVGKIGRQNKPVVIVSNAANPEGNQISFTANILEKNSERK